jgi:hypothetical protein
MIAKFETKMVPKRVLSLTLKEDEAYRLKWMLAGLVEDEDTNLKDKRICIKIITALAS